MNPYNQPNLEILVTTDNGKVLFTGDSGKHWMETSLNSASGATEYQIAVVRAKFRKQLAAPISSSDYENDNDRMIDG